MNPEEREWRIRKAAHEYLKAMLLSPAAGPFYQTTAMDMVWREAWRLAELMEQEAQRRLSRDSGGAERPQKNEVPTAR
jgi:hypothetical protein